MRQGSILKQADEVVLIYANTIREQCTKHATEWKIEQERLAQLTGLVNDTRVAYQASQNRTTRNHLTTVEKNKCFADLKRFLSLFTDYLIGNVAVPDAALEEMRLRPRVRAARHPLPVPVEAPLLSTRIQHGEITVYAIRSEHGQPSQGVQHRPYHGFKLRWRFDDEEAWRIELSTRLRHLLYFRREDEGRRIVLSIAWMNPRLQEGPWSPSVSQVVA
jgi:hypothetical protein